MENIYFELCDISSSGRGYPCTEPYITWLINNVFSNEQWLKDNQVSAVVQNFDVVTDYLITAQKDWVIKNCPSLLNNYTKFLRQPSVDGKVYGRFHEQFVPDAKMCKLIVKDN